MSRNKGNKRKISETVAIIGEGVTERIYFKQLIAEERLHSFKIKPDLPQHPDISNFEKKVRLYLEKGFDKIFCIIDLDNINKKNKEKEKYIKFKNKYPEIIFIENNPCFEIWFLLHFYFSSREYNNECKEVIKYLKKEIEDYEKTEKYFSGKNIYLFLKNKLNDAIINSEKLNESETDTKCEVYKIIKKLNLT